MCSDSSPHLASADAWRPRRAQPEPSALGLLPGYRDFVEAARGSGSVVYRAYQEVLDRPVAVKVLLTDDPTTVERFRREVDITVGLGREHPHIVTVIDTGVTRDGRPCIVMEYHERGSLHDRLRTQGPLEVSEVLQVGEVVADALSFAHSRGVLHRDVKPQNILVLPTSYVVADFGIARHIDAIPQTKSLEWLTIQHAAPQVLDGAAPSVADDIWSVGSTLFTLLGGRPPFATDDANQDNALAYMRRVRQGEARGLERPDIPAGLTRIIDRCLQRDPSKRFADAGELRDALRAVIAAQRVWAPATRQALAATGSPLEQEDVATTRSRYPLMVVGIMGLTLVAGLAWAALDPLGRQDPVTPTASVLATPASNVDPQLAPTLTRVDVSGQTVLLSWLDASQGQASFVVIRDGDVSKAILDVAPGTTTAVVDALPAGRNCFRIIAIVGPRRGISETMCDRTVP